MAQKSIQLVAGQVGVTSGTLDSITAVTAITNPVDVSGSTITIGNAGDLVPLVPVTDEIYLSDGTALTVKFATGSSAGMGDNTIVSAVASKKIRVLAYFLSAVAAVNAIFKSDTGGGAVQKWPTIYLGVSGMSGREYSSVGHFETVAGKALNLSLSAALAVEWGVVYVEI